MVSDKDSLKFLNQKIMFSGVPTVYGIDPFSTETSPSHSLGTIGITPDGRKFRYAEVGGTALVAGNLLQNAAEATDSQALAVAAASIGATSITTTTTVTVTANEFENGYVVVTVTPGLGNVYRIKSHPAATTATVVITLYDPIEVALTTDSRIDMVHNPFANVIQWPATETGTPVGVAFIAAAADTFTWIQTGGVAAVLQEGATAVGAAVRASGGTAGAVIDDATIAQAEVGTAVTGIASGENGAIFLRLD